MANTPTQSPGTKGIYAAEASRRGNEQEHSGGGGRPPPHQGTRRDHTERRHGRVMKRHRTRRDARLTKTRGTPLKRTRPRHARVTKTAAARLQAPAANVAPGHLFNNIYFAIQHMILSTAGVPGPRLLTWCNSIGLLHQCGGFDSHCYKCPCGLLKRLLQNVNT